MEEFYLFNEKAVISKWVADMYDKNDTYTNDIEFMMPIIGNSPKRILEVACGSGRILVPLAKAGHDVFGIDADEFMLAKIADKAKNLNNIQWKKADATTDDWGSEFDVVILAGNILFNIVSDTDYAKAQELFIQKAANALKPGGYVYIDYQPPFSLTKPNLSEDSTDKVGPAVWEGNDNDGNYGKMWSIGGKYDAETQINTYTRCFELTLKSGETIVQNIPSHKHFATLEQLHSWLNNAGFSIEQQYGNYKRDPISDKTRGAIIFTRKI